MKVIAESGEVVNKLNSVQFQRRSLKGYVTIE